MELHHELRKSLTQAEELTDVCVFRETRDADLLLSFSLFGLPWHHPNLPVLHTYLYLRQGNFV